VLFMTMTSGELLEHARKKRKLSREKLVVKLQLETGYELSVTRLRRIETGKTRKRLEDVVQLCRLLDVSLDDLVECLENEKTEEESGK